MLRDLLFLELRPVYCCTVCSVLWRNTSKRAGSGIPTCRWLHHVNLSSQCCTETWQSKVTIKISPSQCLIKYRLFSTLSALLNFLCICSFLQEEGYGPKANSLSWHSSLFLSSKTSMFFDIFFLQCHFWQLNYFIHVFLQEFRDRYLA